MEYKSALESKPMGIAFALVGIIIGVAAIVWFVIVVKRIRKDSAAELAKKQAEAEQAEAQAEIAQKEADNKNRICAYCGNQVPDGEDSCPACGSMKFKK